MGRNHRLFSHTLVTQIISAKYLFNGHDYRPSRFVCLHSACTYANTSDLVLGASHPSASTPVSLLATHAIFRNGRVLCRPSRMALDRNRQRQTASDDNLSSVLLPHVDDLSCVSSVFLEWPGLCYQGLTCARQQSRLLSRLVFALSRIAVVTQPFWRNAHATRVI
jgi:hypothetical protein